MAILPPGWQLVLPGKSRRLEKAVGVASGLSDM